jgi:YVTN family beta-propeller protein
MAPRPIANQRDGTVSVIDTASNTVAVTIPIRGDSQPLGVAVTPDGTNVYVANAGNLTVSVIDTASNTVTTTILVGTPAGVAVTPDGTKVDRAPRY